MPFILSCSTHSVFSFGKDFLFLFCPSPTTLLMSGFLYFILITSSLSTRHLFKVQVSVVYTPWSYLSVFVTINFPTDPHHYHRNGSLFLIPVFEGFVSSFDTLASVSSSFPSFLYLCSVLLS